MLLPATVVTGQVVRLLQLTTENGHATSASGQPNMPDEHAEPEDENDERRRQLEQAAEDPRDRSVGAGGADD
jgi:hypothetical protein